MDRADADCAAPADGGGQGLTGDVGTALARCALGLRKAGARYGTRRLGRLQKCVAAAARCVQRRPGDVGCLARAGQVCAKELAAFPADEAVLVGMVGKACAGVAATDLRNVVGLGFAGEDAPCLADGASTPTTIAEVARCVQRGHACRADELLAFESPRAAELLTLVGRDAGALACLVPGIDGGGLGVGDAARAQAVERCGKAVQIAGAKFARATTKTVAKCARALEGCVFDQGSAAPPCLAGAEAACAKAIGLLARPVTGIEARLAASIAKGCASVPFADVLAPSGLGYAAVASTCTGLGVPTLDSANALAGCVGRQHECRVEQWLERETPRLRELIRLGGTPLP